MTMITLILKLSVYNATLPIIYLIINALREKYHQQQICLIVKLKKLMTICVKNVSRL